MCGLMFSLSVCLFSLLILCKAQIESAWFAFECLVETEHTVKQQCVWTLKIITPSPPVNLVKGKPAPSHGQGDRTPVSFIVMMLPPLWDTPLTRQMTWLLETCRSIIFTPSPFEGVRFQDMPSNQEPPSLSLSSPETTTGGRYVIPKHVLMSVLCYWAPPKS